METIRQQNPHSDDLWADRNAYWAAQSVKPERFRIKGKGPLKPLVLCGHGVLLKVEHGALLVRNGFTHHPQEREVFRFFNADPELPPKIIMVDGSGSISFDVLNWLSKQGVPLIRINWQGEVVGVIGGIGSALSPEKVAWQDELRRDPEKLHAFCADLISQKIQASIVTLKTALPDSEARVRALSNAETSIHRLQSETFHSVQHVRLIEAHAALSYFGAWRGLKLLWKSKERRPVPRAWETGATRARYGFAQLRSNRHATHPINAMLNYGYAILQSQVQIEAAVEGYDLSRGLMHADRDDTSALALDLMEPRRPVVDAAILKFALSSRFSGADFVLTDDGVCRLSPQLARRVASLVF